MVRTNLLMDGDVLITVTVCVPDDKFAAELEGLESKVRVVVWDGSGDPPAGFDDVEFLLVGYAARTFRPEGVARLPRLQVIQAISAGVDDWLRVVPEGVVLANGRGVHGGSTAELAVAGLLSLVRGLPYYAVEQAGRRWSPTRRGEIAGRRVLILGAGDIGRRIEGVLLQLGAVVTLVGRTPRADILGIDALRQLIPATDVVVIAMPLTPQTHKLIDATVLAALPDGAIVVNVGRGAIVDTGALVHELERGRLSAFLDVTDPEPLPANHPLWVAPNVVITPHVGGGTEGWQSRAGDLLRRQVSSFAKGAPLVNVVNWAH